MEHFSDDQRAANNNRGTGRIHPRHERTLGDGKRREQSEGRVHGLAREFAGNRMQLGDRSGDTKASLLDADAAARTLVQELR